MFSPGDQVVLTEAGKQDIGWWWRAYIAPAETATVAGFKDGHVSILRKNGATSWLLPRWLQLIGPPETVRQMSNKVYQAAM